MSADPGNRKTSLTEIFKAVGAIVALPLALFALANSIVAQPIIALVVALITAVLASAWVVCSGWTGITEVIVAWLTLIVVVLAGFVIWPKTMTVEGIICETAGNPIGNEEVVLFDRSGRRYETRTNAEGHYQFIDVPTGNYRVQVGGTEVEGGTEGFLVRKVQQNINVPSTLTPIPTPTATLTNTPTPTPTLTAIPTNTPTPTPTATPMPDAVIVARVNLRSGPGTVYDIISTLNLGQVLTITGRIADTTWLRVITDQMQEGWVINRADLVTLSLPIEQIPIVSPPPTPTVAPTLPPTEAPTPIPAAAPPEPPPPPAEVPAPIPVAPPPASAPTETPTAAPTSTPIPVISIAKPAQKVPCPLTGDCVFSVVGTSTNVVTSLQTVVVFVDPGGGNWWPQNLDFPSPTIQASGDWEGKARIGVGPQPGGTEFRITALLMNNTQVPTTKQPYTTLPPSIAAFGPIRLVCDTCFYANIVSPQGTHSEPDAPSFPVSNNVEVSWEPSECVMIVQYYQNNELKGEDQSVVSGTEINIGAPGSGKTEIKIWREGFEDQSDSIWVWVE